MPAGAWSAGRHADVPDSLFASGGSMDFKTARAGRLFIPQGICCNSSSDANEQLRGYAQVRGYLFGETAVDVSTYRIDIGRPVAYAFACIYATGTTARGIKLLSEA
jgi:hypothetical protein